MFRGAKQNHGFALVELLIVLAIIGILSTIVVLSVGNPKGDADAVKAKANDRNTTLKQETGRY